MIDNNVDPCDNLIIDRLGTKELNKRAIQLCKTIQNNTVLEPWIPILYIALSTEVRSSLNSDYIEQSLGLRYSLRHTTFILQTSFYAPFAVHILEGSVNF